jgi:hypothetical protein
VAKGGGDSKASAVVGKGVERRVHWGAEWQPGELYRRWSRGERRKNRAEQVFWEEEEREETSKGSYVKLKRSRGLIVKQKSQL